MLSEFKRALIRAELGWRADWVVQRLYRHKLRLLEFFGVTVVRSRYGVDLAANYRDSTFRQYVMGHYGRFYWNRISGIKHPFIFIDIGANQGLFTICAARNSNCKAVYAFEPVAGTYSQLQRNIDLNGQGEKCFLFQKALSNVPGQASIKTKSKHTGAATMAMHRTDSIDRPSEKIEAIDGAGLDALVEPESGIPIVVKIDVEGFEKAVIQALVGSSLITNVSEVFYEVDEFWVDPGQLEKLLQELGFSKFQKIGPGTHYDVLAEK